MAALSSSPARSLPAGAADCHAHVMRRGAPLVAGRHSAPLRDVFVQEYLALLDAHGVSYGVLTAPSFYGADNGILLDALDQAPARLRGTIIVEPGIAERELAAMRERGVRGIRLNWTQRPSLPDVSSFAYQHLFGLVRDLDMHVELFLEGELLAGVLPFIQRSGAKAVLDHFGCPDPASGVSGAGFQRVLDAVSEGNTWVKLSAPYRLRGADVQPYVDALLGAGGPSRLIWATDWPWVKFENEVSYAQCIDWLYEWVPHENTCHTILVTTAQDLFEFPATHDERDG